MFNVFSSPDGNITIGPISGPSEEPFFLQLSRVEAARLVGDMTAALLSPEVA
jgi:hypothetical protein